jgi:TonB family protein
MNLAIGIIVGVETNSSSFWQTRRVERTCCSERRVAAGLPIGDERGNPQPALLSAGRPSPGSQRRRRRRLHHRSLGRVAWFAITNSSGDKDLDAAARAVVQSAHFPPPPGGTAHVVMSFNYFPPGFLSEVQRA